MIASSVVSFFVLSTIYETKTTLIVGYNEAEIDAVKLSKGRLESVNANILGAILNKFEVDKNTYSYYNYYYGSEDSRIKEKRGLLKK